MGLFGNILEKLGLKKKEEEKPVVAAPTVTTQKDSRPVPPTIKPAPAKPQSVNQAWGVSDADKVQPKPKPVAMDMVDVKAKLDKMAEAKGDKLDWKKSIVDLLKVLDMDSSLQARKELATELGCPPEKMKESTNMNIWLHKTVLQKIAENGGSLPKELLD